MKKLYLAHGDDYAKIAQEMGITEKLLKRRLQGYKFYYGIIKPKPKELRVKKEKKPPLYALWKKQETRELLEVIRVHGANISKITENMKHIPKKRIQRRLNYLRKEIGLRHIEED